MGHAQSQGHETQGNGRRLEADYLKQGAFKVFDGEGLEAMKQGASKGFEQDVAMDSQEHDMLAEAGAVGATFTFTQDRDYHVLEGLRVEPAGRRGQELSQDEAFESSYKEECAKFEQVSSETDHIKEEDRRQSRQ